MFISFGMYILLIVATLIMLAVIIYLTMTAKKSNSTPRKKTNARKESLQQPAVPSHSIPLNQEETSYDALSSTTIRDESFRTTRTSTQNEQSEDPSLQVLPYPKDDTFH